MNQQNENYRQNMYVSVGVMKDYKLKLRNLRVSHTLSLFIMNQQSES